MFDMNALLMNDMDKKECVKRGCLAIMKRE